MMTVKDLHRKAMEYNDEAIIAKSKGEDPKSFYLRAFEFEKQAFILFASKSNEEPTRSVLLRSAASLAIMAGLIEDAEKLIGLAISGNPPEEILEELRDLFQTVNFQRHLDLKGIKLNSNEIQFSLAGNDVGHGIIRSDEFLLRIEAIEKIAIRTADRLRKIPFRERLGITKSKIIEFEPYLSTPRAASFAVTIQFGGTQAQTSIEDGTSQYIVVNDILENITLLNEGNFDQLNRNIPDESYRNNFTALVKKLAPDGDRIKIVGITAKRGNEVIQVPLKKTSFIDEISSAYTRNSVEKPDEVSIVELKGTLSYAYSKNNTIKLTDENNTNHSLIVPQGLLSDIVKPYFGDFVVIKCKKDKNKMHLLEIDKIG